MDFDFIKQLIKAFPEAFTEPVIKMQEQCNDGLKTIKGIADDSLKKKEIEYYLKVEENRHKEFLLITRLMMENNDEFKRIMVRYMLERDADDSSYLLNTKNFKDDEWEDN